MEHDGHRDRLRKRFLENGADSMMTHELLELLLFYAIPRRNTNETAHKLIDEFGSLSLLMRAPIGDIINNGIGETGAIVLKLVPEITRRMQKEDALLHNRIYSPADAARLLIAHYSGIQDEMISLICLNNKNIVLNIGTVAHGTVGSVGVSSRKLIERALRFNATAAIIAHNHPQGIAQPSSEDIIATESIQFALAKVEVILVDHLIISGESFLSFADEKSLQYLFKK